MKPLTFRMILSASALSLVLLAVAGCGADPDAGAGASEGQNGASSVVQVLGDDFVSPPEGTQEPAPGPDPAVCIGQDPGADAWSTEPFGNAAPEGGLSLDWALTDFQPQSCGYDGTYGLDTFEGHVTVVALLAAW